MLHAAVQHAPPTQRDGAAPIRNEDQVKAMRACHSVHRLDGARGCRRRTLVDAKRAAAKRRQVDWQEPGPGSTRATCRPISRPRPIVSSSPGEPGQGEDAETAGDLANAMSERHHSRGGDLFAANISSMRRLEPPWQRIARVQS